MTRTAKLVIGLVVLAAALFIAQAALAQDAGAAASDAWPPYTLPSASKFPRDPGFYLSTVKILLSWALFALWVKTTDWVGQDCLRLGLNHQLWNPVVFGTFIGSFVLLWVLPTFAIAFPLLLLAYFVPLGAYLAVRNQAVEPHQRVLTPSHIRFLLAGGLGKMGVKVSAEKQMDYQKGAPVDFKGAVGGGRSGEANLTLARQSPAYVPAKGMVADMIDRSGDAMMMEFTAANVAVRYQIDGVWHNIDPLDREPGDMLLAVFKMLAGLDPAERVKRQEGAFSAEYHTKKYNCKLQSQGVEGGERALVSLQSPKAPILTLEELGMRSKTQQQLEALLNLPQGMVLFSSLPQGGLSSLFDGALKACDCYMRDFASVEDVKYPEREVENVHVTTYNPAGGEQLLPVLQKMVRTYPNVIVVRNMNDPEIGKFLCDQTHDERLVLTSIRAKDAPESLLRVLMLKVPPKDFVNAISGAVCTRLVRRLCDECKEAYAPPAEVLQQLGTLASKVQTLFRPPTEADPKKPCPNCQGIGYKGRIGMFELIVVDDGVREALVKNPKIDAVRAAARRAGMKTFQEEGLVLLVKGTTSLTELQRVLKG